MPSPGTENTRLILVTKAMRKSGTLFAADERINCGRPMDSCASVAATDAKPVTQQETDSKAHQTRTPKKPAHQNQTAKSTQSRLIFQLFNTDRPTHGSD